jgi:enediyne biosynthesis protein E4
MEIRAAEGEAIALSRLSRMNTRRSIWMAVTAAVAIVGGVGAWQMIPGGTSPSPSVQSQPATASPPLFEETTVAAGLTFQHWCGDSGKYFFPEVNGSGVALLDYDRDGKLDIFVVQGMPMIAAKDRPIPAGASPTSRLFRQVGPGHFTDVTSAAGLEDPLPFGTGIAVGDVNNDGWPDLYVSKYGSDRLFINRSGKFEDITTAAGIDNPRWGTSACFFDYDRDGWLDLFVANYVDYFPSQRCVTTSGLEDYCNPQRFNNVPAKLFRNVSGESSGQVRFRDVSFETGIDGKSGAGFGVLPADFSGDGWVDLYVANDMTANFLWVNNHGTGFRDEAVQVGAAYDAVGRPQANMGIASGDVDGDGRSDLFITHINGEYSTLYLQVQDGIFEDRTSAAGLAVATFNSTGFGTALADLDLDGDLDLLMGNGRVLRPVGVLPSAEQTNIWRAYAQSNKLFLNRSDGVFTEVASVQDGFLAVPRVTRALATGDIDDDGDLDLVTTEVNGPARLFLNVAQRRGNWLLVRAVDPRYGERDSYDSTVTVFAENKRWWRAINPASSYLASNDPRAHFGLGAAVKYDRIEVRWFDGQTETFAGGPANKSRTLRRGEGKPP